MRGIITILFILAFGGLTAACSDEPKELKSPCVGAEGSPCDWHKPVNNV